MNKRTLTGKQGEELAVNFLKRRNYRIIERNYRYGRFEIDLILLHQRTMIFAEVKTRSGDKFGFPEEMVGVQQAERIMIAAQNYIFTQNWRGKIRFDIIAIRLFGGDIEIRHFEDAFY